MIEDILSINDKIELIKSSVLRKNEAEQKYYKSHLVDIKDDSTFIISMPVEEDKLVVLDIGESYNLWFYTKRGLYTCTVIINEKCKQGDDNVAEVYATSDLEKLQRRQYYRLNCIMDFEYKINGRDEFDKGVVIDMSGGGLRFNTEKKLEAGTKMLIRLNLFLADKKDEGLSQDEKDICEIKAKVVDSELARAKSNVYENRIEFDNISGKVREKIVRFIFEVDRQRRQNSF